MTKVNGHGESRAVGAEARPMQASPATWKIVLATVLIGTFVGTGGVLLVTVLFRLGGPPASDAELKVLLILLVWVLAIGSIASLASGLGAVRLLRKWGWLEWHHTIGLALASCLTPLALALMALPFTISMTGLSVLFIGTYAGIIMLPVALISALICRPIILWLLGWKRPLTV